MEQNVSVGDIVQVNPKTAEDLMFVGCLVVVTEVKSWGIQGYVPVPTSRDEAPGLAFVRLAADKFVRVGAVEWMIERGDD